MADTPHRRKLNGSRAQALFDQHYAWKAQYEGEAEPKKVAAGARRTATSLRKAASEFRELLNLDQWSSLNVAASVMTQLAQDLDTVCQLAERRKIEFDADELARRNGAADATAEQRWQGDTAAMLVEARELAMFVDCFDSLELTQWVLRDRPGLKYVHVESLRPGRRLHDMLNRLSKPAAASELVAIRRRAAEYVAVLADATKQGRVYKDMYYAGLDDYEAWRRWHREISAAIKVGANSNERKER